MSFAALKSLIQQTFPPKPKYTDADIPDLTGKVCIVTGANTGVGKDVAQMLYAKNAKVYVAARSEEKARNAMDSIKATVTGTTTGHLEYLHLDLADLTTIKPTVQNFLSKESQLHVLINNAGVAFPGQGTKTAQGYELQLGVNCLGPFLLTKLLSPTIVSTAKASPPDTVRVVWTASSAAEGTSPKGYMDNLDYHKDEGSFKKYSVSKMGNYFHSSEYAQRYSADGIASVSLNPGNLDTDLWRTQSPLTAWILRKTVFYPIVYGAYTTVFAAFSPLVQVSKDGTYVAPWGRVWQIEASVRDAGKRKADGGAGTAQQFWDWSEEQVKPFV